MALSFGYQVLLFWLFVSMLLAYIGQCYSMLIMLGVAETFKMVHGI